MDQQHSQVRGRSPSVNNHQPRLSNTHATAPACFPESADPTASIGLGLNVDPGTHQLSGNQTDFSSYNPGTGSFLDSSSSHTVQSYAQLGDASVTFDLEQSFAHVKREASSPFGAQSPADFQPDLLATGFGNEVDDFTIFPPSTGEGQFNNPLFVNENHQVGSPNVNMITQSHHSPTPPHIFKPEPRVANRSPSFNQHRFSRPGGHSRNASLGPEAALLPGQLDWSQAGGPQFHTHRRSLSEYSDVSSVAHSPNLVASDNFDVLDPRNSPLQRPQDMGVFQELHRLNSFSISDHGTHSPSRGGRSPSHSPAISPRILPQQMPDMNHHHPFMLQAQNNSYGPPATTYTQAPQESFPQLCSDGADMGQMPAPPAINIDFAPTSMRSGFEGPKSLDIDSLTPPERGRPRLSRPRAVTDPYNSGGAMPRHRSSAASLSPQVAVNPHSDASRSLSPLDRSSPSCSAGPTNRRRQSTSAVPNNVIALRLADPEYKVSATQGDSGAGGQKRVQKHPATFQCTLCPKRFTRAYNLRSHLRTHTDERPFVCTVCGKAFARQHDRKRHEGLHSGEKRFVCKGDLQVGGQWGCGRRFARADALGRHFRSEAGRICIKPLLDEEMLERQRVWNEQHMQAAAAQGMVMQSSGMMMSPGMDPSTQPYPMDASGNYTLPQALLTQYPALAQINWTTDMAPSLDDDLNGRGGFDTSDYDDGDNEGYVSGAGSGYSNPGNVFDVVHASDYGG